MRILFRTKVGFLHVICVILGKFEIRKLQIERKRKKLINCYIYQIVAFPSFLVARILPNLYFIIQFFRFFKGSKTWYIHELEEHDRLPLEETRDLPKDKLPPLSYKVYLDQGNFRLSNVTLILRVCQNSIL